MITRILVIIAAAITVLALLLTLVTATIVAIGFVLNHFVSTIPLEFACVVAGLTILILISLLSGSVRLVASFPPDQSSDDDFDEEEPTEFAEQIAEIVSEKLEPHIWKQQRSKSRRR